VQVEGVDMPELLASTLVLVVTGALKTGSLDVGLRVVGELTRALAPAAALVETSTWSASWGFLETPVDGDSILPALSAVMQLEVPAPLTLAFGVVTPWGEYVPLSFRASTLAGSTNEALVNAVDVRSRYKGGDRPPTLSELNELEWFELVPS